MATSSKYRSYLNSEENKDIKWRFGAPPNYEAVDELFEQGRTKVWPPGSAEEMVQNLVKTWEMELFHKACIDDYKTVDPYKFTYSVNGTKPLSLAEMAKLGGGYNSHLQTSLPEQYQIYNPSQEDANTSHILFTTTFPRGFALEVLQLYSGPPLIVFKFRHWGYMEGPFKSHAPTGELIELFGMAILELDESKRIEKVEFFYDRGELLGRLIKGETLVGNDDSEAASSCPFLKNTG
ncbi:hypothetical protein FNV43_RR10727 [Rhamnella rubrinervis]|uniref:Pathogen-related protein n=1 Tax=Rhamnella rubrinervis TaxID=2594499 RepID=A0A8K0MGZ6_9ROSA|nr:hypothetical protein FNV43_RR10727 [Rhamnella rubrinervis]